MYLSSQPKGSAHVIPKYWSWKTLLVTFPSSGRGVTESLALDQAPFTKMTPVGTFVSECESLERLVLLLGESWELASCPQAGNAADKVHATKR